MAKLPTKTKISASDFDAIEARTVINGNWPCSGRVMQIKYFAGDIYATDFDTFWHIENYPVTPAYISGPTPPQPLHGEQSLYQFHETDTPPLLNVTWLEVWLGIIRNRAAA